MHERKVLPESGLTVLRRGRPDRRQHSCNLKTRHIPRPPGGSFLRAFSRRFSHFWEQEKMFGKMFGKPIDETLFYARMSADI